MKVPNRSAPNKVVVSRKRTRAQINAQNLLPAAKRSSVAGNKMVENRPQSQINSKPSAMQKVQREINEIKSLKEKKKEKFARKVFKGLKKMIDQARNDICLVTSNPYFLENDPKWMQIKVEGVAIHQMWYLKSGFTSEYLKEMIIDAPMPIQLPFLENDEWINFCKAVKWRYDKDSTKSAFSLESDLPLEWGEIELKPKRLGKSNAEDFVKKALFLMCEDYSEFLDKTLPQMKDVLKAKGMLVGDVFFMKYKEALLIAVIRSQDITKLMQKVKGTLSDDTDAVHELFEKKLTSLSKSFRKSKSKPPYPEALKIIKLILKKTVKGFF